MTGLGQVIIDDGGTILSVDPRFCATMRAAAEDLVGRNMLDLTSLADRERCIMLLDKLLTDRQPIQTVKRLVRADRTHVWVQNRVEVMAAPDGDPSIRLRIDIEEGSPPSDWVDPAELLNIATFIFEGRRKRSAVFAGSLFADHAWDILLAAYIAEARGRALTIADLHALVGISLVNASRWMRALSAEGMLEYEDGGSTALITSALRLSCEAHRRFERYLSELHRSKEEPAANLEFFR